MSHGKGHRMHTLSVFAIVAGIAFVFGSTVARVVVGSALIAAALAFAYVMFRVVMGTV